MRQSYVESIPIRGLNYNIRHWGETDKPIVFLLHGWMDVSATFQFFVDACQKEWHFVAPDWRGFGASTSNHATYWAPDYLGDLDAILDHYSPQQAVTLMGHSLGGNVACVYSGIRPERVAKLISLEGFGMPPTAPDDAPEHYRIWLDTLKTSPQQTRYPSLKAMAQRLQQVNPRLDNAKALFLAEHFSRATAFGDLEWAADPWHRVMSPMLYRIDEAKAIWRRVMAKTLWVGGKDSIILQRFQKHPQVYIERRDCFRDLTEVIFENAGHNMHHDQPVKLAELIENF